MSEIKSTDKIAENPNSPNSQNKVDAKADQKKVFHTKLFSLFLLALLIIPAVLVSPVRQNASVLGVSENINDNSEVNSVVPKNEKPEANTAKEPSNFDLGNFFGPDNTKVKTSKIGQIGSGAQEIRAIEKNEVKAISGKVIWDENARSAISTDKFPLGSSIKVNYNKKDIYLVVGDTRVLSSDTVLVVNRETFVKLGGNPEKENKINVNISLD